MFEETVCALAWLRVQVDRAGNPGYGRTDAEWEKHEIPDGIEVARQGMLIWL